MFILTLDTWAIFAHLLLSQKAKIRSSTERWATRIRFPERDHIHGLELSKSVRTSPFRFYFTLLRKSGRSSTLTKNKNPVPEVNYM